MNLYIYHVSVIKVAYSTSVGMMGISGQNLNTVVYLWLKDGIISRHKAPNVVNLIKNGSKTWHVWDDETQLGYKESSYHVKWHIINCHRFTMRLQGEEVSFC